MKAGEDTNWYTLMEYYWSISHVYREKEVTSMSRMLSSTTSPTRHYQTLPLSQSFGNVDFEFLNNGAFQEGIMGMA